MTQEKLIEIIQQGEGLEVEFKTSTFELNKDTFESVCAFLNRKGGHLILGVSDKGKVEGIIEDCVPAIANNFVTMANNSQKLNPPFYLSPEVFEIDGKKVIYVRVPESSLVHNTNGKIFDRNQDGDLDITRYTDQVTQMYLKKQTIYTENRVFSYVELADFNPELFKRVRARAEFEKEGHPWSSMTDAELMRSAGLYKRDPITDKEGYTLAGILLLGKDITILNALPHHRTDAILRREDLDRYDDRDDIRTNLIDSYDRLMAFIAKHLSDKFYLEKDVRTSLRDRLFREVVSNLLIHREFSNGFPAKLIIENDRVYTENWSRPHGGGVIDPENFSPFPKNPVIAKFFHEIGRVDELGSGVRNTFKYCEIYTPGTRPEFIEGDVFKTIIPLKAPQRKYQYTGDKSINALNEAGYEIIDTVNDAVNDAVNDVNDAVKSRIKKELVFIITHDGISINELKGKFKIERATAQRDMRLLKATGWVDFEGPAKTGKYRLTAPGKAYFGDFL